MLHYRAQRYGAARTDLQQARELGADPAIVLFDLALVNLASGDRTTALDNLGRALSHDPQQADARKLRAHLLRREGGPGTPAAGMSEHLAPAPSRELR